ncbi:MAG: hypothetical protein IPM50_02590 [Acidobacteriota bacterium]|nr:MAG: hypothetical protein IPM50_02590 [Acidobacteriota bacterium]
MTKRQDIAAFILAMTIVVILGTAFVVAVFGQNGQRPFPTPSPVEPPYVFVETCPTNTVAQTYALGTAAQIIVSEGCTDIYFRKLYGENWHVYGTKTITVNN